MSYQVIARKWRPQTFEEVTGQEPITRTLRNAIEHERLHHAYLFSGARGVGKTTTARLLAKALNCHKSDKPTPTPCRADDPTVCPSCKEISEGRSIDVLEIDAASNTGVDNVRDAIIGNVAVAPARDRYKVFIIDEVHMLSGAAFNALLKTLEEPPSRVVFIMATTELHKVPDTILSRCQQFEFRTIPTQKISERLRLIAEAEKIKIADDALREVARAGEGSMRDAQSAFDQVISFAGATIKTEDVEAALGLAGTEMLSRVMRGIAEQSPAEALAVVDDLVMRGQDLRNFCRDLQAHLRNLLVAKVSGDSAEMLEASAFSGAELARQAHEFSESDLVRFFHSLTETETNLRTAPHPRYQLEVGLVKVIEMRRLAPINQLVERISALEEALRTSKAPAAAKATPPASSQGGASNIGGQRSSKSGTTTSSRASSSFKNDEGNATEVSAFAESADDAPFGGVGGSAPRAQAATPSSVLTLVPPSASAAPVDSANGSDGWSLSSSDAPKREDHIGPSAPAAATPVKSFGSVIDEIKTTLEKRLKMFLVIALEGARKVAVEGEELYVEFAPESKHLRDSLAKPDSVRALREACREVLGRDIGVRIVVKEKSEQEEQGPASRQDEERQEKQRLRELAEQSPLVQEVLRTFRAEIVDVRRVEE